MANNRMTEELPGGLTRETNTNGPAIETLNARLVQIGPFRQDNLPRSQAATALTLGATDANAPTGFVAGSKGRFIGVVGQVNADPAGVESKVTLAPTIAGAASSSSGIVDDVYNTKVTRFATPISFVQGAVLGMKATVESFVETTIDLSAWLLVEWDPTP